MNRYRYLLDTNIVSDLMRNPQGSVAWHIRNVGEETVCTSIIVACELRFGVEKKGSAALAKRLDLILGELKVLPLQENADRHYGIVRAFLERAGQSIGGVDLFIAAHAMSLGLTLVTANTREFTRIPKLDVANWLEGTAESRKEVRSANRRPEESQDSKQKKALKRLTRTLYDIASKHYAPGVSLSRGDFRRLQQLIVFDLVGAIEKNRAEGHYSPDASILAIEAAQRKFEQTHLAPLLLSCRISDPNENLAGFVRTLANFAGCLIFMECSFPRNLGSAELLIIFDVERLAHSMGKILQQLCSLPGFVADEVGLELSTWQSVYEREEKLRTTDPRFLQRSLGMVNTVDIVVDTDLGAVAAALKKMADLYDIGTVVGYRLPQGSAAILFEI